MLEFITKELYAIEETEYSRGQLINFFINGHRNTMVALYRNGIFNRLITYSSLLHNETLSEAVVTLGPDMLSDAMHIFSTAANRIKLLPIVDENGVLLSIMRWNNQIKENEAPIQSNDEIEAFDTLYLSECSDKIVKWVEQYLRTHTGKTLILEGEGWEVLMYGGLIICGDNTVELRTDDSNVRAALELSFISRPKYFNVNTVKSMWKLKEQYVSYRLYVGPYDNKNLRLLMDLLFEGINVEGAYDFAEAGIENQTTLLGKPVECIENIIKEDDIAIICESVEDLAEMQNKFQEEKDKFVVYANLFEIKDIFANKKNVIVFDSNDEAKKIYTILANRKYEVYASCYLGKTDSIKYIESEKSITLDEVLENSDEYNVILASDKIYKESILGEWNCVNAIDIYTVSRSIAGWIFGWILFGAAHHIDRIINEKRKIVMYGVDSCATNKWLTFFNILGTEVYKFVDDYEQMDPYVESVYNICYETEKPYVIINKKYDEWDNAVAQIRNIQFGELNKDYIGVYSIEELAAPVMIKDVSLGFTYIDDKNDGFNKLGFEVYGSGNSNSFKIMTLGGSTTTSIIRYTKSWPELLYEKLCGEGYSVTIYNAGINSYTAAEELYKLIRDGSVIRPDMVISFSGANNLDSKEHMRKYQYVPEHLIDIFDCICGDSYSRGLECNGRSVASIWVEQEQMMHAISTNVYGASFYAFAQPQYYTKKQLKNKERLQFEKNKEFVKEAIKFRKEVSEVAKQYNWLIDIQHILDDRPDVIYDMIHVYEEGNRIIADEIYKYIIKDIEEQKK